jgi:hypothetical protein
MQFRSCSRQEAVILSARDDSLTPTPLDQTSYDAWVTAVALRLLASSYTILPASSAENLPLLQQRTGQTIVTALRLHSRYRFSPAAGHHARESSETSAWPGLYSGPHIGDQLVESSSRQRLGSHGTDQITPGTDPTFESTCVDMRLHETHLTLSDDSKLTDPSIWGSQCGSWSDGPSPPWPQNEDTSDTNSSSSSTSHGGILDKFMCQAQFPRVWKLNQKSRKGLLGRLTAKPDVAATSSPKDTANGVRCECLRRTSRG